MQAFTFTVTVSGTAQRLSTLAIAAGEVLTGNVLYNAEYLPATKIFAQCKPGASAGLVYLGPSTVDSSGTNAAITLAAATATAPGAATEISTQDVNVLDLSQWWIVGAHATDTVAVTYHQT